MMPNGDVGSYPTTGNIGQLAPNMGQGIGNVNQSLFDKLRQFAIASLMARAQQQQGAPMQQPQQQQMQQQQNPAITGGYNPTMMGPQQTGLTPQFGAQVGNALRGLIPGQ